MDIKRTYFVAAGRGRSVAVDTTAICDERLSWKAKGLHYYIRTQLEALNNQQELVAAGPDGRDAVATGVKELIQHKYLHMMQKRDEAGQFVYIIYVSFPAPVHITQEELSTLLSTGYVPMSPPAELIKAPDTENPVTDAEWQESYSPYYITTLYNTGVLVNSNELPKTPHAPRAPAHKRIFGPAEIREGAGTKNDRAALDIFEHWNKQPGLPTHRRDPKTKKYRRAIAAAKYQVVNQTYPLAEIIAAIEVYNTLLTDDRTWVYKYKQQPIRVGLDEFFKFANYSLDMMARQKVGHPLRRLEGTSWMQECMDGKEHALNKYLRLRPDKYPELTKVLEDEMLGNTTWHPNGQDTWEVNGLRSAAVKLMEVYELYKAKLPQFNYYVADFARDFINMVCTFKDPHPRMLGANWVWAQFDRYLIDMELIDVAVEVHHDVKAAASN